MLAIHVMEVRPLGIFGDDDTSRTRTNLLVVAGVLGAIGLAVAGVAHYYAGKFERQGYGMRRSMR